MKKFRFRLETLRKIRETHRDEMRSKLAEAHQAVRMLEDQIALVQEEALELQTNLRSAVDGTKIDINGLLVGGRYQSVLRAQLETMKGQIELLETEVERRRLVVVEADREVRVLDKLEERQRAEHRKMQQRAEINELDEIGSLQKEAENRWAL